MSNAEDETEETEPYLEAVIDDAIGPIASLMPPVELRLLRRALRDAAEDDPALAALYAAAHPRAAPATSGEAPIEAKGARAEEAAPPVPLRRKGGAA